ncbi:unnamed protein product, partial [marine sediment metagenome]
KRILCSAILQERFIILNRLKKKLAKDLGDRIIL